MMSADAARLYERGETVLAVSRIISLLARHYPHVARQPRRRLPPLDELVLTVLSQNTSDVNSGLAFRRLCSRFSNWRLVAEATDPEIEEAIRPGGLGRIKAARIKAILEMVLSERGDLDLGFLKELSLDSARSWLRRLPGVGPKTAACVLLFSLNKPAMPVDTHVRRVATRLGLLPQKVSVESAHDILERLVPTRDVCRLHVLLIEHGRQMCRARRPHCQRCPLLEGCPFGTLQMKDKGRLS